ncbi:glycoside hydrolase family 3 N-terminal domain-containing protein [Hoyosella subflava]|uniref:beta-N-acetylhexosaminidase n=1 Tax=Hoyosella subflava (strain DSM 45089 / JCM 17490 / NBRC 109087 / DQS3-9A1) TaxID=443218 RepID=F6EJD3_HOYSD|nr:glycoside hydrolase family 3 N-terminal domain-containing protein [Hoyosella subflava]AEF42549.1 Lipoprotein LpqI [Hoyosella subflava DQS3-9A1]
MKLYSRATRALARPVAAAAIASALAASTLACTASDTEEGGAPATDTSPAALTTGNASPAPTSEPPAVAACSSRDEFLAQLTTRQKLAQLLNVGVTGKADALSVVNGENIGGIFVTSWADPNFLASGEVRDVAAESAVPLMVTIDEEGGRVSRASHVIGQAPSARQVAQTLTVDETYELARERGGALRELGVTADFAPVVDVTVQADSEVIGDRAFGATPEAVTEYAGAYARGLRDAGVLPVLKHFPGHGSGTGDSHYEGVTTPPLDDLIEWDLVPYRNLIDVGAAVMVGHLTVPGLTEEGLPSSLSPATMSLLRDGEGYGAEPFDGLIFTDDLGSMRAVTDHFDITESVLRSLQAGADVALWISTDAVTDVLDRLEDAVESGELPLDQVEQSAVRVGVAKGLVDC